MAQKPKKTVAVKFGTIGLGRLTGRLGVTVSKDTLDIMAAEQLFCGTQLHATLTVVPKKEADGQKSMLPDQFPTISGVFDVKRYGSSPDGYSFGLTFNLKAQDISEMKEFRCQSGKIQIFKIDEIAELEEEAGDEDVSADQEEEED